MNEPQWHDVIGRAELPEDEVLGIEVRGRDVALYIVGGQVHASDNLCTHGQARLCDGFLEGHEIECPLHQGRFDVRTGAATCGPAELPIAVYPVKIEDGRVWLDLG